MRFVFLFADGTETEPNTQPTRVSLRRDADTPADSLELTFTFARVLDTVEMTAL